MINNCQELVQCLEKSFKERINITVVCLEASVVKGTLDNKKFSIIYIPNEYLYLKIDKHDESLINEFKIIYEKESYGTNPLCSYELSNDEGKVERIIEWSKYPEERIKELKLQENSDDERITNLKIYYNNQHKSKIKTMSY